MKASYQTITVIHTRSVGHLICDDGVNGLKWQYVARFGSSEDIKKINNIHEFSMEKTSKTKTKNTDSSFRTGEMVILLAETVISG